MIPERKNDPLVICGFPGIGKTSFAQYMIEHEKRLDILDLDSKPYKAGDSEHPNLYCVEIEKAYQSKKFSYILVSCHKKVRAYMQNHGIPYVIVIPDYYYDANIWMSSRNEYMARYSARGDSVAFMKKIYDNWYNWMDEMMSADPAPKIQIHERSYIENIFGDFYILPDVKEQSF